MSSQAPSHAPNFSKLVLCRYVRVQVGNLIVKCAPPARAMENQQCPARPQTLPPTFPNWSRLENVGSRCKPFKNNFPPFHFERCQTSLFWFGTDLAQPVPEHMSTSANQCQPVPKHMPSNAFWLKHMLQILESLPPRPPEPKRSTKLFQGQASFISRKSKSLAIFKM